MISTTKVLCFVAIAFADSDFQTDHDAVMRELSEGENQGLDAVEEQRELADAIEEFRELVGDTDEFRELADAITDEDREVFFRKWSRAKAAHKKNACKSKCARHHKAANDKCRRGSRYSHMRGYVKKCQANADRHFKRCNWGCKRRQLDEDEEVSAAVLV